jgi:uncharacterized protein with FMN-binding domain
MAADIPYHVSHVLVAAETSPAYANGTFVGDSVDTEWGPVQVRIIVRGGTIAGVDCFVYPGHRRRSEEISGWSLPVLAQEVIHAQSAKIDIVTEATLTSLGYQQSVATALTKARRTPRM